MREYPTKTGPVDYMLFVDAKAVGVIEAKREETAQNITVVEEQQQKRAEAEQAERQSLYRTGIKGLVDRFTGRHARLKSINEQSFYLSLKRDQSERDGLIFSHIEARERLADVQADVMENYQMVRNALLAESAQSLEPLEEEPEILRQLHRRQRDDGLGR